MTVGQKMLSYCAECFKATNHTVVCLKATHGSIEYQISNFYCIIECNGCNNISYRTETKDFETMHYVPEEDDYLPYTTNIIYPQSLKYHNSNLDLNLLPQKIRLVYIDAINAFAAKCLLLTGVAFRAIIEAVCLDKAIKIKEFEDLKPQIEKLYSKGFITENERDRLHLIRFLGNDSIHAMAVPTESDLYIVLEMVEHLLKNLYIIDKQITDGLETLIKNYDDFEILLDKKLRTLEIGEVVTLKKILGAASRRLNDKAVVFERDLIHKIRGMEYKKLALWETKPHQDAKQPDINYYKIISNI